MKRTVMLLASMAVAVVLGGGTALAVLPDNGGGSLEASASGRAKDPDAKLDRSLERLVGMRGGPPGVIAIIQRGQNRDVHSFGVADVRNRRSIKVNDRMRIASAAKAFSGAAALSLVSRGRLSLDDTIGERLPGLPDAWSEVTLRQLLGHTSGLPDFSQDKRFQQAVGASLKKAPPPERLLTYVYRKDLLFDPGSRYKYSNSDNIAVALMVEDETGKSYEGQLRKLVYKPLGLGRTSLPSGTDLKTPFIHGYDNDPSQRPPEDYSKVIAAGWAWASGGIVSTPANLNDFIRGYVGGELFNRRTQQQQRRVFEGGGSEPPGPGKNSAGLAVFRYETKCGTVWGHTGNTPGYTQFMAATRDGRRSVTVSINRQITRTEGAKGVFKVLRQAETNAVCAALSGR